VASSNGKAASNGKRTSNGNVRVAIVGVGNCASSLVQGRYHYADAAESDFIPGLMHVNLGGYHVRDIDFVAAFDVDKNKVGKDLSEAIFAEPNNTFTFADVPKLNVPIHDDIAHNRVEDFIRGDDNEVLNGTQKVAPRPTKKLSKSNQKGEARAAPAEVA